MNKTLIPAMFKKLPYYLAFILFPFRLFAWGHAGHQMVAELAMSMLSDATRAKVERILNGMTPAEAGTWMDDIRSDPKYKYTAPWHFANIEEGGTYKPAPNGDIITALNKAYTELQHMDELTPEQVKFDVLVLFHLCGDLLQPLHVGYGSDKGGNTYQVQYNGKGTNLHAIWDSRIIEKTGIKLDDLKQAMAYSVPPGSQPVLLKETLAKRIDFDHYLNVGRNALKYVYDLKGHQLDDAYMQRGKPFVLAQLTMAGHLLASCLETLFSKVTNVPTGPVTAAPSASQKPANADKTVVTGGTITPDQAAAHIGEQVIVCGKVYGTRLLDNGPTFLNMGGEYPDNPFTAVIMFNKRGNFSYKPEEYLKGKTICVTGVVKNYKGKPEIVVDKEGQVKVQ